MEMDVEKRLAMCQPGVGGPTKKEILELLSKADSSKHYLIELVKKARNKAEICKLLQAAREKPATKKEPEGQVLKAETKEKEPATPKTAEKKETEAAAISGTEYLESELAACRAEKKETEIAAISGTESFERELEACRSDKNYSKKNLARAARATALCKLDLERCNLYDRAGLIHLKLRILYASHLQVYLKAFLVKIRALPPDPKYNADPFPDFAPFVLPPLTNPAADVQVEDVKNALANTVALSEKVPMWVQHLEATLKGDRDTTDLESTLPASAEGERRHREDFIVVVLQQNPLLNSRVELSLGSARGKTTWQDWATAWFQAIGETTRADLEKVMSLQVLYIKSLNIAFRFRQFVQVQKDIFELSVGSALRSVQDQPKVAEMTRWEGLLSQEMLGMTYLVRKHPGHCVLLPTLSTAQSLEWQLSYDADKDKLAYPVDMWHQFEKCKAAGKRLVVVYMRSSAGRKAHANMIIYDTRKGTAERFEPHGTESPIYFPPALDERLERDFKAHGITYLEPSKTCPNVGKLGPQTREGIENDLKRAGDPGGFCAAWSLWYADLRMTNPDLSPDETITAALAALKRDNKTLKVFIRSYSDFLLQEGLKWVDERIAAEAKGVSGKELTEMFYAHLLDLVKSATGV